MPPVRLFHHLLMFCIALAVVGCGGEKKDGGRGGAPTVVVGTNPDYPPMQFIDPQTGRMVGLEIDLMEAIAREGGFEITWKNVEWKGIFAALEARDIDAIMSAATITEERKQKFDFSDPYYTISQRLVVLAKDADQIKSIGDLRGRRIGVQLNTTGALLVEKEYPDWDRVTFDNTPLAFADLLRGAVFGFMVDEPVADEYSRANPQTANLLVALPFEFSKEEYGIVVRKGDTALLTKINEGLRKVREAGIDREIKAKWVK
jgi:polar amino acid transport system substrate-binding protein